ncbi:unnamed protein product [Vitrella brassicaformis CCMP3155]|uniref:Zinc/iron permease n=2 Tax=Vitrella brassicaformis TaxID=1169539 RepID=A0A0G4ENY2_VITBC|nr:unnamed protein product [Vitrella brassicaformis CCMP3155]|eukprot:CEL99510.1 unnamed protein product [Vitrella brassicaformis CCMP3155]
MVLTEAGTPALVALAVCSFIVTWAVSFASCTVLSRTPELLKERLKGVLCFGVAAMLSDVFLHIIPHVYGDMAKLDSASVEESMVTNGVGFLLGIAVAHGLDILLQAYHVEPSSPHGEEQQHGADTSDAQHDSVGEKVSLRLRATAKGEAEEGEDRELVSREGGGGARRAALPLWRVLKPVAALNLMSDLLHNGLDGMSIAVSFQTNRRIGLSTSLAILAHEVAQEFADFAILVHSGLSPYQALVLNVAVSFSAIVGGALTLLLGAGLSELWKDFLLCFAGGNFLYISLFEILPETVTATTAGGGDQRGGQRVAGFLLGFLCLYGVRWMEQ